MLIAGIDPGTNGAIAVLDSESPDSVALLDLKKSTARDIYNWFNDLFIDQIDSIIKGKKVNSKRMNSKSFATTTILMGDDLSSIDQFKDLVSNVLKKYKK